MPERGDRPADDEQPPRRRGWPVAGRAEDLDLQGSATTYGPPWFTLGFESTTRVRRRDRG